jgi:hypothetical protein
MKTQRTFKRETGVHVQEYDSILDLLSDGRIFSIEKQGDRYVFTEGCDCYFEETLSEEEFVGLIEELQALFNKAKASQPTSDPVSTSEPTNSPNPTS